MSLENLFFDKLHKIRCNRNALEFNLTQRLKYCPEKFRLECFKKF